MARDRYQEGRVVETGRKRKVWRGHFYVYSTAPSGEEIRKHRNVSLGPKSQMKKWEAEKKLREIIAREASAVNAKPDPSVTLTWFWENRFLPLQAGWRESTRIVLEAVFRRHVLSKFGEVRLNELKRFDLQTHVNSLATAYSKSLVKKARTWVKAVLDEAVEQGYLDRNPARKLALPPTRGTCKRFLTIDEYHKVLGALEGRERLIFRLFVLGAFRPGELFALRWGCFTNGTLRVEASVFKGKVGMPKTKSSAAPVTLPKALVADLRDWHDVTGQPGPDKLIFPSTVDKPINAQNFLKRILKPAAKSVGIEDMTFQALRRTFATHFHGIGTVKDQQSQMRHSTAQMTMDVYTQAVSESLRTAMESFDQKLKKARRSRSEPDSETPSHPMDNEPQEGFEPK